MSTDVSNLGSQIYLISFTFSCGFDFFDGKLTCIFGCRRVIVIVKRILLKWLIFSGLVMLQNGQCHHTWRRIIYDSDVRKKRFFFKNSNTWPNSIRHQYLFELLRFILVINSQCSHLWIQKLHQEQRGSE